MLECGDKPLCATLDGFTLHAATRAGALDVAGREALLRYVLRPPSRSSPYCLFFRSFSLPFLAFRGVKATSDGREFDGDQTDMRGLGTA